MRLFKGEGIQMRTYLGFADGQSIPKGYDKYIWISERCTEGIEYCEQNNLSYDIIPKVFHSAEDLYHTMEYLAEVEDTLISWLTPILNEYSGVSYEAKSWSFALARSLDSIVKITYEKYLRMKLFYELDISAECYLYDETTVPFLDYGDLSKHSWTNEFHLYVYSSLIAAMGERGILDPTYKGKYIKETNVSKGKLKIKCKAQMYNIVVNMLRLIGRKKEQVVMMDSYLPSETVHSLMLKYPGRIVNYVYNYADLYGDKLELVFDKAWRMKKENIPDDVDDFTKIMMKSIKRFLPIAMVENFNSIERISKKIYKHADHPNAIFYSCSAFYKNECFKNYLMRMREKEDITFCNIQHGGGYGIKNNVGIFEWKNCDRFYTWGWDTADYSWCEFFPMPVPKMVNIENKIEKHAMQDILFADYEYDKNLWDIDCDMIDFDKKRVEEMVFFETLPSQWANKMRIRKFPAGSDLSIWNEVQRKNPHIKFDDEKNFYKSLAMSRLVILASFETTVYEALYMNKPFLIIGNRKMNTMQCVKEDIEMLENIGILIYSFDDLAKRLQEIYPVLEEWWQDLERQKVILYMQKKYARRSQRPEQEWEREISTFLK